jgi:hypothetical protein
MELDDIERMRIIASYWDNPACVVCESGVVDDNTRVDADTITLGEELVIYLRDIEDITDDDCVALGKMFGHVEDREYNTKLYVIMRVKKLLSGVDKHSPNSSIDVWAGVVDYLRKHRYAVPYKGHSLFELGIAKRIAV